MTSNKAARDRLVIERCLKTITPRALLAIIDACTRGCGEARNLAGILALAGEHDARPAVVAAAFGFLPDAFAPGRFVDAFTENDTPILDTNDSEIIAAFCLARGAFGGSALPSMLGVKTS